VPAGTSVQASSKSVQSSGLTAVSTDTGCHLLVTGGSAVGLTG
jgi:hypothetical protein